VFGKKGVYSPRDGGAARLRPDRMISSQITENTISFIANELAIKLNLMPEFFHLLGRAQVR
jgi:hypothetical protein